MSLFTDKRTGGISMTRVVAISFTIVYLVVLVMLARRGVQPGWPMALLGIFVLLAVPLQALFAGADGARLATELIRRIGIGDVGQNATAGAVEAVMQHRHDPGA